MSVAQTECRKAFEDVRAISAMLRRGSIEEAQTCLLRVVAFFEIITLNDANPGSHFQLYLKNRIEELCQNVSEIQQTVAKNPEVATIHNIVNQPNDQTCSGYFEPDSQKPRRPTDIGVEAASLHSSACRLDGRDRVQAAPED
eukprot:Filipodium_phascolosomae@DN4501_c0_g1_i1.p1